MTRPTDPLPPLPCLRAFLAVAELGSFTRAAERLALTQTAISHQIARLEEHVGQRLFHRGRGGVALTAAGRRCLPAIEAGLARLHEGIAAARPSPAGAVTLATTPEFGSRWLAPRLERLLRDEPGLQVRLALGYGRADLLAGEADLAVWLGPGGAGLDATRLGLEKEFVVCAPALAARLPRFQAFLSAPLLRYSGARHTVLDWERFYEQVRTTRYGTPPRFDEFELGEEFADFDAMIEACKRGEGFALVRSSLVRDDLDSGDLVNPFEEVVTSDLQYHVVVPAGGPLAPDVARLRDWIVAASRAEATSP